MLKVVVNSTTPFMVISRYCVWSPISYDTILSPASLLSLILSFDCFASQNFTQTCFSHPLSLQDNERTTIDQINAHKSFKPPVDHTLEGANSELKAVFLKRRKEIPP